MLMQWIVAAAVFACLLLLLPYLLRRTKRAPSKGGGSGVMLGIGVLHMLPHAIMDASAAAELASVVTVNTRFIPNSPTISAEAVRWIMISLLAGMLTMFFIESSSASIHGV